VPNANGVSDTDLDADTLAHVFLAALRSQPILDALAGRCATWRSAYCPMSRRSAAVGVPASDEPAASSRSASTRQRVLSSGGSSTSKS